MTAGGGAIAGEAREQLLVQLGERSPLAGAEHRQRLGQRLLARRPDLRRGAPARRGERSRRRSGRRRRGGARRGRRAASRSTSRTAPECVSPSTRAERVDRLAAEVALERGERRRRGRPVRRAGLDGGLDAIGQGERERAEEVRLPCTRMTHSYNVLCTASDPRTKAHRRRPRDLLPRAQGRAAPRTCPSCGAEHATLSPTCPSCDKRYDRRFPGVSDRQRWALGGVVLVVVIAATALILPGVFDAKRDNDARVAREQAARVAAEKKRLTREQRRSAAARPGCARPVRPRARRERLAARRKLVRRPRGRDPRRRALARRRPASSTGRSSA